MGWVPQDALPAIEEKLRQSFQRGGVKAVVDFWQDEILGRHLIFNALLADFQLPRLLAVTRGIIAPADNVDESHPDHITSVGHYWIEQVSGPIYAITNDAYRGNGEDFVENEPHEQAIAQIARLIIKAAKEMRNNVRS